MNHLLVYSEFDTPRLRYVLQWILGEQLGVSWSLTTDQEMWSLFTGPKINYAVTETVDKQVLWIKPVGLLSAHGVKEQKLLLNRWKHSTVLFYNKPGAVVPFDIFSAVFYLLSRYEEYLPHKKDRHGRYEWRQSAAGQYAFLQQPVVDEWVLHFGVLLQEKYGVKVKERELVFQPSYDIDLVWRYLYKGLMRNAGAYAKDLLRADLRELAKRIAVQAGNATDPFFCFDKLDALHHDYELRPVYFWLLGKYGKFDKNTAPHHPQMQQLIQRISAVYDVGIHPSYGSHTVEGQLKAEIGLLEAIAGRKIINSRQHFIKFDLPESYRQLITEGIRHDFSMGYAAVNGFRAGTSNSFLWYDLPAEVVTVLRVHPFAFMDATSRFYYKSSVEEVYREWERLYYSVLKVKGTFSAIWHNYILSDYREHKGWLALYERCLHLVTGKTRNHDAGV